MKGFCGIVNYSNDFVCCFQYKKEAEKFYERLKHTVRYVRFPDLFLDLQEAGDNGTFAVTLKKYTKPVLLIIDEWLLLKLTEADARNLFELIHKSRKKSSTISSFPVS